MVHVAVEAMSTRWLWLYDLGHFLHSFGIDTKIFVILIFLIEINGHTMTVVAKVTVLLV
jgi:hypothetical protein